MVYCQQISRKTAPLWMWKSGCVEEDKKIHEKFSLIFSLITFYINLQSLTYQTQKCWICKKNRKQRISFLQQFTVGKKFKSLLLRQIPQPLRLRGFFLPIAYRGFFLPAVMCLPQSGRYATIYLL